MNISKINNIINSDKTRKAITTLGKSGTLLPIILLETTVTGGRTIQAYKRDGYTEARERFCEESIGAVFWLWGVKMFNKLGDMFGKHVLKIPETEFDVGKDPLRKPFENLMADITKKTKKNSSVKNFSREALAGFKFGKIILSVIAATSFIGYVVPKINQSITRKVLQRGKARLEEKDKNKENKAGMVNSVGSIEDFRKKVKEKKPAFKGALNADVIATIAHDLENHPIYRLLATDAGILSGRTVNARNNDERVEIIFRDSVSLYFYMLCTKHVIGLMGKTSKFGNIAKLDPVSANKIYKELSKVIEKDGKVISDEVKGISAKDFRDKVLGTLTDEKKAILEKLKPKFNNNVISSEELLKELPKKFHKNAVRMSTLQPRQAGAGRVLTLWQVEDVLKEGIINDPKLLKSLYIKNFGKDLVNPYKFIPMKQIQNYRNNIEEFVKTILDYAESQPGETKTVTEKVLKDMNKSNLYKFGGFFATGFFISALFLSTIIPKTQYLITKLRTGKNEFPGKEDGGARRKLMSKDTKAP